MSNRKNPFSRIRLVYRRSSTLLKCVVLGAIVLATAALLTLRFSIGKNEQTLQQLQSQAARLEQEQQDYKQKMEEIGTGNSIMGIAEEELGLVKEGSIIFQPIDSNP